MHRERDAQGVPAGVPGCATVLRVINNSHYNQATSSTSGNVYAKRSVSTGAPLILNAPEQTTVGPSQTTSGSSIQFSYDGQSYGVAPTVGNLTSKSIWFDLENRWITTSNTYGLYGNLATSTDARGKVTTFGYDNPALGLPNHVTVNPENGTGTQTTTSAYDYSTGLVTSTTDANGNTSNIDYTNQLLGTIDPFGRPGVVIGPDIGGGVNHRTRTFYEDNTRTVTVLSDLNSEGDGLLKSQTISDMLGRTIETRQYETASAFIAVRQSYDVANRIAKTSNPFRAGEPVVWTTTVSDLLGRVVSVTTPDNASVVTAYSGNRVLVADQNTFDDLRRKRISETDALGRLKTVWEVTAADQYTEDVSFPNWPSVTKGYKTTYQYDALDNLTQVSQGSQPARTFAYDSLRRLTSATNPESGTVSYQYDENGNLIQKTDARGIVSTYAYDALNRNISVNYSNTTVNPDITRHYDNPINRGKGRYWHDYFYKDDGTIDHQAVDGYDALGRPWVRRQVFHSGGQWYHYETRNTYNLAGQVISQQYPSGHVTSYQYDAAGRTSSFSGNLGDGTQRTYASSISYSSFGGLQQEQFGTTTPLYHKKHYNVRGQLWDMRASTVSFSTDPADGDRGAIVNYYSSNYTQGGSGTDNNGNLLRQENYIPGSSFFQDNFEYDQLNRLKFMAEKLNGTGTDSFKQAYVYDRWGNRTIDQVNTSPNVPKPNFGVDTSNNRLTAPAGYTMGYDQAGNLTNDTFTGEGVRTYDAENRMTSAGIAGAPSAAYAYDGDGRRIKRIANGTETWQVYGIGGELLAEYDAANASASNPQKEYGYRNGELLITAEPGVQQATERTNVALASNGATASASSTYAGTAASATINGDRKGLNYGANGSWGSGSSGFPQWLQVDFNGSQTIEEIDVFTVQDNYASPSEPTEVMTFSLWGLTGYEVQYWNGSNWVTITGGSVSGNNNVWRKFTFTAVTTSKIRVLTNASPSGWSELTEVEAWSTAASPPPARTNVALAANGATASASSTYTGTAASGTINGDRKGLNYGANGTWGSASSGFPQWLQVDFNGSQTIDEIDVFTLQDNYASPSEPTESMTFSQWGLTGYEVQYWNGSTWATVTGGSVSSNNRVWRKFTFTAVTTSKIRVLTNASPSGWSEVTEVEAWTTAATPPPPTNVALASNGATASASSSYSGCAASGAQNGDRKGLNYGQNGTWAGASATFTQWLQIDFNGSQTIDEIDIFTLQDNYASPSEPTEAMTFSLYGVTGFEAQYWNGSSWLTVPGGSVTGNNKVWRKFTFPAITTSKVRVVTNASLSGWSELTEVEAWTAAEGSGSSSANINWLVTDHLGTPRMIFDQTGSLANVSRHDYLPFGEELFVGTGGRTTAQGYGGDNVRQKFTGYESDSETGLNFAQARYHSPIQGRFVGADPLLSSGKPVDPQSWNRYTYVLNNPLVLIDPTGLEWRKHNTSGLIKWYNDDDDRTETTEYSDEYYETADGQWVHLNLSGPSHNPDDSFNRNGWDYVDAGLVPGRYNIANHDAIGPASSPENSGTIRLTFEFFTGTGPTDRQFGPFSYMTQGLMSSPDVAGHRQNFITQGGGTYGPAAVRFGVSGEDGPFEAGFNMPRQFVGSFYISIRERAGGEALFVVDNTTHLRSLLYNTPGVQPVDRSTMAPLSTKAQTFWWVERGVIKR
jgi:RHS repeat-associated protein